VFHYFAGCRARLLVGALSQCSLRPRTLTTACQVDIDKGGCDGGSRAVGENHGLQGSLVERNLSLLSTYVAQNQVPSAFCPNPWRGRYAQMARAFLDKARRHRSRPQPSASFGIGGAFGFCNYSTKTAGAAVRTLRHYFGDL